VSWDSKALNLSRRLFSSNECCFFKFSNASYISFSSTFWPLKNSLFSHSFYCLTACSILWCISYRVWSRDSNASHRDCIDNSNSLRSCWGEVFRVFSLFGWDPRPKAALSCVNLGFKADSCGFNRLHRAVSSTSLYLMAASSPWEAPRSIPRLTNSYCIR
jgi:hypothetical protein